MARDISNLSGETLKRELHRRSLDLCIVHNPTDEDFVVQWDTHQRFRVPRCDMDNGFGAGNAQVPRYIAVKYMKEMTDKILIGKSDKLVEEEKKRRVAEGLPKMEPWEQEQFESKFRTTDPENRKEVMQGLWVRIDREYGIDFVEEKEPQKKSTQTPDDFLIDLITASESPEDIEID